jgi:hypothetical protein
MRIWCIKIGIVYILHVCLLKEEFLQESLHLDFFENENFCTGQGILMKLNAIKITVRSSTYYKANAVPNLE